MFESDIALLRDISPQSTAVHLIRSGKLADVGEVKHKPDGATERVDCHALVMAEGHGILLHQLTRTWKLGKTVIGPPLITFGFYPKGKPYNIYAWFDERDSLEAAYFNVVSHDGFWVHDFELHYDDRVLDLLCLPGEPVQVLDEDELWQLEPEPRSEAMEAAYWLVEHWDSELRAFPRCLRQTLLGIAGMALAIVRPERILTILGNKTSIVAATVTAAVGSIVMMPVISVLPVASHLLQTGASLMHISVFLATLTTVGVDTLPLESRYIGKPLALLRNALAFGFAIIAALLISALIG